MNKKLLTLLVILLMMAVVGTIGNKINDAEIIVDAKGAMGGSEMLVQEKAAHTTELGLDDIAMIDAGSESEVEKIEEVVHEVVEADPVQSMESRTEIDQRKQKSGEELVQDLQLDKRTEQHSHPNEDDDLAVTVVFKDETGVNITMRETCADDYANTSNEALQV